MRVRADDHFSAAGVHLTHKLMNHRNVRRHIDPAVFFRCRQSEHMIVIINCSSDCAERIVAAGQNIGKGEFFHSGSAGRLDNPDIGNVMGRHRIKFKFQMFHIP